jgi:hypothetical protein
MKTGDIVVFIGKDLQDKHLSNFTFGYRYKIKSVTPLPDGDYYVDNLAVLFEDFPYGVIKSNFEKYFINVNDFRNHQIVNIIQ